MKKRLNVDNKKLTVSRDLAGAVRAGARFLAVGLCTPRRGKPCFTVAARRHRKAAENEILLHSLFNVDGLRFMEVWHYVPKKGLLLPVAAPYFMGSPAQAASMTLEELESFQTKKNLIIL